MNYIEIEPLKNTSKNIHLDVILIHIRYIIKYVIDMLIRTTIDYITINNYTLINLIFFLKKT